MAPLALFGTFGLPEILVILLLAVFLFGGRKIPDLARGLGEGIRNFRSALRGDDDGATRDKGGDKAGNDSGR